MKIYIVSYSVESHSETEDICYQPIVAFRSLKAAEKHCKEKHMDYVYAKINTIELK